PLAVLGAHAGRALLLEQALPLPLRILARGDIQADPAQTLGPALLVAGQLAARFEPADGPFRPHDAVLEAMSAGLERLGDGLVHADEVLGVDLGAEGVERATEGARGEPVDRLERGGPNNASRGDRPLPGAHLTGLDGQAQPFLALAGRRLRALAL